MSAHLGDDLELYALGDLSSGERAKVEAHVADCAECARALGEAEQSLAELSGLLPSYRAPRRPQQRGRWSRLTGGALAAAFVVGMIVAGGTVGYLDHTAVVANDDARARVAMLHSHFAHVPLEPVAAGAPRAKIVYPPDRSWLYAIVDDGRPGYRLIARDGATARDLGTLAAHDETSSLFVTGPGDVHVVELVLDGRVVARGMLR
ncbi:MAG: zf-HC2 domain-containing protein [Candidatus Eremiobacteraeota bacterium]|nr:zf-HC2 domain-containing protein [Candidatus Eremiobacteraeota bacterium]